MFSVCGSVPFLIDGNFFPAYSLVARPATLYKASGLKRVRSGYETTLRIQDGWRWRLPGLWVSQLEQSLLIVLSTFLTDRPSEAPCTPGKNEDIHGRCNDNQMHGHNFSHRPDSQSCIRKRTALSLCCQNMSRIRRCRSKQVSKSLLHEKARFNSRKT